MQIGQIPFESRDGVTRCIPFKLEPGESIYLDLVTHKFKVLYRNREYSYFADEGRARKEVRDNPGAVLQILGGK